MIINSDVWTDLASEVRNSPGIARRRIPMKNDADLYAAMISPCGFPALIIEAEEIDIPSSINVNCYGFLLRSLLINKEGKEGTSSLLLELADPRFRDVFIVLAEDIALQMNNAIDKHLAIKVFFNQLNRWREFFDKTGREGLSKQQQQGLYGELVSLKEILIPLLGIEKTVVSWVGPEGANQDFSIDNVSIEVKTSVSPPHEKFAVSNVLQLNSVCTNVFVLVFLALETRQSNQGTLPQLVTALRSIIAQHNPQVLDLFNARLMLYGYLNIHEENYCNIGYSVRKLLMYQVREGFPMILVTEIPNGVGDIKYSVSISACSDYEIQLSDLIEMIS